MQGLSVHNQQSQVSCKILWTFTLRIIPAITKILLFCNSSSGQLISIFFIHSLFFQSPYKCPIYNGYDCNFLQLPKYYEFNVKPSFLHFILNYLFIYFQDAFHVCAHTPMQVAAKFFENSPPWTTCLICFIFDLCSLSAFLFSGFQCHHLLHKDAICYLDAFDYPPPSEFSKMSGADLLHHFQNISSNLAFTYFANLASYYGQKYNPISHHASPRERFS